MYRYFKARFNKKLCNFTGYYYFHDTYNTDPQVDSTWYKPFLAFPDDIDVYVQPDLDDYMQGKKYSEAGFEQGPYCTREGNKIVRAKHIAFLKPNAWRDSAYTGPEQIDLEKAKLGSVVAFMDELKDINYKITDYALVRSAITNGNWKQVLHYMHLHSDRILIQLYGLLSFAKTAVPMDEKAGILEEEGKEVLDLCIYLIDDPNKDTKLTHQLFAFMALHNIFCTRAGRMEYFSAANVMVQGARREEALDEFYLERIKLLLRCIDGIEVETFTSTMMKDGVKVTHIQKTPTQRGVDIAEYALLCLGLLAQNPEQRELLAANCVGAIMRVMMKCQGESGIATYGLRVLYNLCYRCEAGQLEVNDTAGATVKLIEMIKSNFQGDADCMKNCRRFELAIEPDGWRGNVETTIGHEMALEREKRKSIGNNPKTPSRKEEKNEDEHLLLGIDAHLLIKDKDLKTPHDEYKNAHEVSDKKMTLMIAEAKDDFSLSKDDGSKASVVSHTRTKHEYKHKARDMKFDDDDISITSDITL